MSNVLIVLEHADKALKKASLSAVTFGRQAAEKSGGALHFLVVGKDVGAVAEQAAGFGAAKVWVADHDCYANMLAESYTDVVSAAAKACDAGIVAAASTSLSKDAMPRVAARLDAAMASDVMSVVDDKTFTRPMWAGDVIATVELTTPVRVCTVRATEFDAAAPGEGGSSEVAAVDTVVDLGSLKTQFVSAEQVKSERPDATVADRVVSGGRGVKSPDGFKLIEDLADKLGAGVGASRAVCDAGWVPNDLQIGQTGKVVAPDLYMAVGLSGAIQHLAGMKGSKVIVAINKDPEAPIFGVADYGLVADLFEAVPELMEKL